MNLFAFYKPKTLIKMKKVLLIVSTLFVVISIALTSCGTRASDSSNQASAECCGDRGKVQDKDCCDSTRVNASANSDNNEGCCSGKLQNEPCVNSCEHNHN